jgi:hypothetical protein
MFSRHKQQQIIPGLPVRDELKFLGDVAQGYYFPHQLTPAVDNPDVNCDIPAAGLA